METVIGIIDYGMGNLHSVKNALDFIGVKSFISEDIEELSKADGLILPGVGAFPDAMKRLSDKGIDTFVKEYVKTKPLMGICLGMQLLFTKGYEFSECEGLNLICGEVALIDEEDLKIPHIGWNELKIINESPLTKSLKGGEQVYFVHSYEARVKDLSELIAVTDYGHDITAIVGKGNVFGCQFHPEKSESVGLGIIKNFCDYVGGVK